jgi:hypothetical protein
MTMQAVATLSNHKSLCIGEITSREAEIVKGDHPIVDGYGLYLIAVDARNPSAAGTVLAKFLSEDAAAVLAQFFRIHGRLEPA